MNVHLIQTIVNSCVIILQARLGVTALKVTYSSPTSLRVMMLGNVIVITDALKNALSYLEHMLVVVIMDTHLVQINVLAGIIMNATFLMEDANKSALIQMDRSPVFAILDFILHQMVSVVMMIMNVTRAKQAVRNSVSIQLVRTFATVLMAFNYQLTGRHVMTLTSAVCNGITVTTKLRCV